MRRFAALSLIVRPRAFRSFLHASQRQPLARLRRDQALRSRGRVMCHLHIRDAPHARIVCVVVVHIVEELARKHDAAVGEADGSVC